MRSCLNSFTLAGILASAAVFALLAVSPAPTFAALVANSKHNLSVSGPGTVKATTESEICVFCHAPHNASPAASLWNKTLVSTTYTPYTSSTLKSAPGQPNGSSLLCLGCHDGTIALGKVRNRASNITLTGGAAMTMPAGNSNLGVNLSDDPSDILRL